MSSIGWPMRLVKMERLFSIFPESPTERLILMNRRCWMGLGIGCRPMEKPFMRRVHGKSSARELTLSLAEVSQERPRPIWIIGIFVSRAIKKAIQYMLLFWGRRRRTLVSKAWG